MCTNVVNKTSISETVIMEVKRNKLRRKLYAREFKLTVVDVVSRKWKERSSNITAFNLDRKQVCNWVKAEEKIRKQKLNAKAPVRAESLFP